MTLRLVAAGVLMLAMPSEVQATCSVPKDNLESRIECLENELNDYEVEFEDMKKSNLQIQDQLNKMAEITEKHNNCTARMFAWINDRLVELGATP